MAVKTHKTIDTIYSADTVEWCPIPELADVLVCGTYQLLQESEQTVNSASNTTDNPDCDAVSTDHPHSESAEEASSKNRAGRCLMYALNHDDSVLNEVARCDANAILDVKWRREASNHNGAVAALFATVDSVGGTVVYKVSQRETAIDGPDKTSAPSSSTHDAYALEACASHTNTHFDEACGTELLNLACEWTYGMGGGDDTKLLVSATDGTVCLYSVRPDSDDLLCERKWLAHSSKYLPATEAWTCTSNAFNGAVVYSGGEDAKWKAWDVRDGCMRPLWTANAHEQGVCSMQAHPTIEHILATGSYDEKVMVWDTRVPKQPLSELDMGGGVWRIKWHPDDKHTMLTACIYNNFHIVQMSQDHGELNIVHSYEEHASLAYGADWHRSSRLSAVSTIATCSFYDHKLDLWRWDNQ